ncbi:MAG: hypothetical protein MJK14_00400 [Rivularia sp. ALOHA_DT_140]|nr:hypothetical protein [Rivularia sp. ALOHA_DT_140]
MGIAFLFGAGHGKTMVKDCLIGSQATAKQALLYSLVTTIAHTASIFVLGLLGLFASRYIVPEQLYAILSFLSGCTICGVGFWLLASRFENKSDHSHHHGFPEINYSTLFNRGWYCWRNLPSVCIKQFMECC